MHTTSHITTKIERNNSIIRGLFSLECTPQPQGLTSPFLTGRDVFLANAKSGIWLLVNQLQPLHVWVPSYLCHTIIGAINLNITELRFYGVDYDLTVRSSEWISEVASGDLVIFIDYFGYPHDHQLSARVKEKGALVTEDASRALLSCHVGTNSDFVLFSPRKYIGIPDGGILRVPESFPMNDISLEMPPTAWWLKALLTVILRREFDDGLPAREWFRLFSEAVRQTLFDHEIYSPPVHWEIENVVPAEYEESHRLSRQIMTLPCDQRYGTDDMEKIADVFLQRSAQHK